MARVTLEQIAKLELRRTGNLQSLLSAMRSQGLLDREICEWTDIVRRVGNSVAHESLKTEEIQFFGSAIVIVGVVIQYYGASALLRQRDALPRQPET